MRWSDYFDLLAANLPKKCSLSQNNGSCPCLMDRTTGAKKVDCFFLVGVGVIDIRSAIDTSPLKQGPGRMLSRWLVPRSSGVGNHIVLDDLYKKFDGDADPAVFIFYNPRGLESPDRFAWKLACCTLKRVEFVNIWALWLLSENLKNVEWYGEDIGRLFQFPERDFGA